MAEPSHGYVLDRPAAWVPWEARIPRDTALWTIVNGSREKPGTGCRAWAAGRLAVSDTGAGAALVARLERAAWQRSRQDPAVRKATATWHSCMRKSGYRYANPVEAPYAHWQDARMRANPRPTAAQRRQGIPPTGAELAAARADVRCKQRSGLLRTWAAAEVAEQQRAVAVNVTALRAVRAGLDATAARARDMR